MSIMPKVILVKARTLWGFSIKYPTQTAMQDSIPLPPPTTVLGALAAQYARYNKLPETLKIGTKLYSSAVKLLLDKIIKYCTSGLKYSSAIKYSDISRSIMLIYQRYKEPKFHFAAQSTSKVYTLMPESPLLLICVTEDPYAELIYKLAWGISSVGSKEGLVSVTDVALHDLKVVSKKVVDTYFITPSNIAECVRNCIEVELCGLAPESYLADAVCKSTRFLIPVRGDIKNLFGGSMRVNVTDNAVVTEIPLDDKEYTYIVLPKEVIS